MAAAARCSASEGNPVVRLAPNNKGGKLSNYLCRRIELMREKKTGQPNFLRDRMYITRGRIFLFSEG